MGGGVTGGGVPLTQQRASLPAWEPKIRPKAQRTQPLNWVTLPWIPGMFFGLSRTAAFGIIKYLKSFSHTQIPESEGVEEKC